MTARHTLLRTAAIAAALCLGLATAGLGQAIVLNLPTDPAARAISVTVTPGLTRTAKLPSPALRDARKRMIAGQDLDPADLRALAEHWDGLAAQKYVRHLLKSAAPGNESDIAYFGTIAISTGRVWPMADVVAALRELNPETEPAARKKAYVAMLYPHAWAGNALALDAVMDLNGPGKLFGEMSDATRKRLLEKGAEIGDGRVPLRMAVALLQQPGRLAADTELARTYLLSARGSANLAISTTAANLLTLLETDGAMVVVSQ